MLKGELQLLLIITHQSLEKTSFVTLITMKGGVTGVRTLKIGVALVLHVQYMVSTYT